MLNPLQKVKKPGIIKIQSWRCKAGRIPYRESGLFFGEEKELGTEIIEVVEVINNPMVNSWLTAGKTVGLLIISVVVIIITLAKTGVINKFFDLKIQKLGLSTGFNKDVLKKFEDTLGQLHDKMTVIEEKVSKNTEAIREVKADVKDIKIEALKKAIFDKDLYLIDRMAAGIRYMLAGCNSESMDYLLNQLCFEDLEIWDGLCKELKADQYWRSEKDRPKDWKTELPKRAKGNQNGTVDAA